MKIVCSKDQLLEAINVVQKAVSSKTPLPILEGILLEANDKFKLTGNDLEIGIEYNVEADIIEKGSIVLNSKLFGDIVRKLPDFEVSLKLENNDSVIIDCKNSHFELKGINPEGFPSLPIIERLNPYKITQKLLKDMIRQTIFAVGNDENKKVLTGSLIQCSDNKLNIVAIDGFRMAFRNSEMTNDSMEFLSIVPGKTLNEILKIIQPVEDEIIIYSTQNLILFELDNCKIISRLINGEYINYKTIIPNDFETKIRVNVTELLQSIERAALMTNEDKKYPIIFNISGDKVIICTSTTIGNVREELFVECTGNPLEAGYNPKYFIDVLKIIEEEIVDIYFTSSIGPCIIRPTTGDHFAYMILPVRIK